MMRRTYRLAKVMWGCIIWWRIWFLFYHGCNFLTFCRLYHVFRCSSWATLIGCSAGWRWGSRRWDWLFLSHVKLILYLFSLSQRWKIVDSLAYGSSNLSHLHCHYNTLQHVNHGHSTNQLIITHVILWINWMNYTKFHVHISNVDIIRWYKHIFA